MTGPVLLCFDGSDEAAGAIRHAAELLAGREAIVLSVAVPAKAEVPLDPMSDLIGRLSGLYRDWDEVCAEIAERQAHDGSQRATDHGFRARPLTAVGKIAPTILRIADEHDAAVIVLGTGAQERLGGLLGSVATRVIHHTKRPVLLIPASAVHT